MSERKKRTYNYKEFVATTRIKIDAIADKYRLWIYIPFESPVNKSVVLVILKNPSKANTINSDYTVNKILKLFKLKYDGVYIMNLFPIYSTDPKKVKVFMDSDDYRKCMEKNKKHLEQLLSKDNGITDIIVAWGSNTIASSYIKKYDEAIADFITIIKSHNKIPLAVRNKNGIQKTKYPLHAQVWRVNKGVEIYKF